MKYILLFTFVLGFISLHGQCPTTGNWSQADIDNFSANYPNCTSLEGTLQTFLFEGITNLHGLSQLTRIDQIEISKTGLKDLKGLENLTSVAKLKIYLNDKLLNLDALKNIKNLKIIDVHKNPKLESLIPFKEDQFLTNMTIYQNMTLKSLNAQHIISADDLSINNNPNSSTESFLNIEHCNTLMLFYLGINKIGGFGKLKNLNKLYISKNNNLTDISSLEGLNSIQSKLVILNNKQLDMCDVLCPAIRTAPQLEISGNATGCNDQVFFNCFNNVFATVFYDKNQNKIQDTDEIGIPNVIVRKNELGFWNITNQDGQIGWNAQIGKKYPIKIRLNEKKWRLTTDSLSYLLNYDGSSPAEYKFGLFPVDDETHVDLFLVPNGFSKLNIVAYNSGVRPISGKLTMTFNDGLFVQSGSGQLDAAHRTVTWDLMSLQPFEKQTFPVKWQLSDYQNGIQCTLKDDNNMVLAEESIDRLNDYVEYWSANECAQYILPQGIGKFKYLDGNQPLTYWISPLVGSKQLISNTKISNYMDVNSFEVALSSHHTSVKFEPGVVRMTRKHQHFAANHPPYFVFRMSPKPDVPDNTRISSYTNMSSIIAFGTNTCTTSKQKHTLVHKLLPPLNPDKRTDSIILYPNPADDYFTYSYRYNLVNQSTKIYIYNMIGEVVKEIDLGTSVNDEARYYVGDLNPGLYFVVIGEKKAQNNAILLIQR